MPRYSAEIEAQVIDAYKRGEKLVTISKSVGISRTSVTSILIRQGLHQSRKHRYFTNQEEIQIAEMYQSGQSLNLIGEIFGMDDESTLIYQVLRRQGVIPNRQQKYVANRRAFKLAPGGYTENQKYWGGFILADGCLSNVKASGACRLSMGLQERDKAHVEKFRDFLQTHNKLTYAPPNEKGKGGGGQWRLAVGSAYWIEELAPFGVYPRKTNTAEIPEAFVYDRDYWRGVIDGDGWLGLYPKRDKFQAFLGVCGSHGVCKGFETLAKHLVPQRVVTWKKRTETYAEVSIRGDAAAEIVFWLYSGSNIYLDRKYEIAIRICNYHQKGGLQVESLLAA